MSLYYDAASIIEDRHSQRDSLKLSVFAAAKKLRSPAPQLIALLSGTLNWNEILKEVIDRSGLLKDERKLTPELSLVLVHDLLFSKKGVSAPANHPLRVSVEKHRARLQAEITKLRVKRRCTSLEALKSSVASTTYGATLPGVGHLHRPRWVRINTLKTSLRDQLNTAFRDYEQVSSLNAIVQAESEHTSPKVLFVDEHIPNLVAVPSSTDIVDWKGYREGKVILQNKASCFPAYLLDPQQDDYLIDACAAPGNKTTHLAALIVDQQPRQEQRIWACERDKSRAGLLQRMIDGAGADRVVIVRAGQDFLKLDPNSAESSDAKWSQATALLLDPSCSGSGMIGRDEAVEWKLPASDQRTSGVQGSKKRKREEHSRKQPDEENEAIVSSDDPALQSRLQSLAAFQLRLLLHAFSFPAARKITYSTCSVYEEENEKVVLAALVSTVAKERGWSILPRADQVEGMRSWHLRGNKVAFDGICDLQEVTESCIRCSKTTEDGTQGFFVAAFRRTPIEQNGPPRKAKPAALPVSQSSFEEVWEGFAD